MLYHFELKKGFSIAEHINNYIKLLTFILTLINEKQSLNYNDVLAASVNYEVKGG